MIGPGFEGSCMSRALGSRYRGAPSPSCMLPFISLGEQERRFRLESSHGLLMPTDIYTRAVRRRSPRREHLTMVDQILVGANQLLHLPTFQLTDRTPSSIDRVVIRTPLTEWQRDHGHDPRVLSQLGENVPHTFAKCGFRLVHPLPLKQLNRFLKRSFDNEQPPVRAKRALLQSRSGCVHSGSPFVTFRVTRAAWDSVETQTSLGDTPGPDHPHAEA